MLEPSPQDEDMTENDRRSELLRSYAVAADVVAHVRPEQLDGPTPCAEYDVGSIVDHLVGAGWRAAALGRGENSTGDAFPHVELSDAPDQLQRAAKEARVAWSDEARLAQTLTMPWGEEYTGATLVDMYLAELAAHTWDVAVATGQSDRLDSSLARSALDGARAMLRPEYRDAMGRGNPFGVEVDPPVGATDWERFAAFMGRPPRDWLSPSRS